MIERKQTMMFSATLAPHPATGCARDARQPQQVQIDSPQDKHRNIKAGAVLGRQRPAQAQAAGPLAADATINQAIVFCQHADRMR